MRQEQQRSNFRRRSFSKIRGREGVSQTVIQSVSHSVSQSVSACVRACVLLVLPLLTKDRNHFGHEIETLTVN